MDGTGHNDQPTAPAPATPRAIRSAAPPANAAGARGHRSPAPAGVHPMKTRSKGPVEKALEDGAITTPSRKRKASVHDGVQRMEQVLREERGTLAYIGRVARAVRARVGEFLGFGLFNNGQQAPPAAETARDEDGPSALGAPVVQEPVVPAPVVQELVLPAPPNLLDMQLISRGLLADDANKVQELQDSALFFHAVAERIGVPACADLAQDLFARALGLDANWRGLAVVTVKVVALCEAVRKLAPDEELERVVDAAVLFQPVAGTAVAQVLLQQALWVQFRDRPYVRAVHHTIPAFVQIVGRWQGWPADRQALVTRAARVATALGVAGSQQHVIAAASVSFAQVPIEEIVDHYRMDGDAVATAVAQIAARGVAAYLDVTEP